MSQEEQIELFLKELRDSADIIYRIFTSGSCYRLYPIMKTVFPNATAWWSDRDNHCVVEIEGNFYDIGGKLNEDRVKNSYYEIPEEEHSGYKLMKYVHEEDHRYHVTIERYKS